MLSVTLGYAGGSSWRHVEHLASRIGLGALVVVLLGLTGGYLVRRSRSSGWAQRQTSRLRASRPATGAVRGFPAQVAWTRRRVDPTSPTGLPLTAAVLVALGAAWIFLGITHDVVAREELATLDPRIHLWVLQHRTGWLDTTMRAVTWLGANAVVVPMLAISAVLLCRIRHSWAPLVPIVAVYTACVLLHALVGDVVRRPRPTAADWLTGAGGWSYPSGHTIQATAAYGVLLVLLAEGTTPRVRRRLTLAAVVIVALVATSRVYLGVHWASDVFGSISLGTLVVSLAVITRLPTRGTAGDRPDPPGVPSPVHEEHSKGSGGLRVSSLAQLPAGGQVPAGAMTNSRAMTAGSVRLALEADSAPPGRPGQWRSRGPAAILLVALAVAGARVPFVGLPLSSYEGGFLLVASQWSPGQSPYGNHWADRPPLLIGFFELADRQAHPKESTWPPSSPSFTTASTPGSRAPTTGSSAPSDFWVSWGSWDSWA